MHALKHAQSREDLKPALWHIVQVPDTVAAFSGASRRAIEGVRASPRWCPQDCAVDQHC